MISVLGRFALILALGFALIQSVVPLLGIWYQRETWLVTAKPAALGQFFFITLAISILIYSFLSNDFSIAYVAANSNSHLPWPYRIAAVWGAHEGSLLLWITFLGLWSAAAALFSKQLSTQLLARVLIILGFISGGFLLFLLLTSDPFRQLVANIPVEGADLNPLLQDPGLAIHPPMLYMGYVGFSVVFAFAIAALWNGQLDSTWARQVRPWTLLAWCFLTLGITLGSWWAYRVLGWGGWWFWDPVENASLLPWLSGTALIHASIATEKRNVFKSWTVLLAICTFSLSLVGTFLVRSGVLISVHAFANDPARGLYLLQFLALIIGGALLLYAVRAPVLRSENYFNFLSRETFLLANNVLLMVMMGTILLGTLYPLVLDVLGLGKISVGPPYFNTVFVPLITPLLILMGIGPLCQWYETDRSVLFKQLLYPFLLAIGLSISLLLVFTGSVLPGVALGLFLAFWIMLTTLLAIKLARHKSGMVLAHMGIAICVIGITLVSNYKVARDVRMQPGDYAKIGPYNVKFIGVNDLQGPNYEGVDGIFQITPGHIILRAEQHLYTASQIGIARAAIDAGLIRDIYIALGEPLSDGGWGVRIYYQPFVRWIWCGGLLVVLGGLFSLRKLSK